MKTSNLAPKVSNPVEIARARLVAAQTSLADAKQERRAAKHRRKQAEVAARRAKKELRRAREELEEARVALNTAEINYADDLKAAIRAKKRPVAKVVRPMIAKKKTKKRAQRKQLGPIEHPIFEPATPDPVPVETVGGDFQISSTVPSPIEPEASAPPPDQITQEAGSA